MFKESAMTRYLFKSDSQLEVAISSNFIFYTKCSRNCTLCLLSLTSSTQLSPFASWVFKSRLHYRLRWQYRRTMVKHIKLLSFIFKTNIFFPKILYVPLWRVKSRDDVTVTITHEYSQKLSVVNDWTQNNVFNELLS